MNRKGLKLLATLRAIFSFIRKEKTFTILDIVKEAENQLIEYEVIDKISIMYVSSLLKEFYLLSLQEGWGIERLSREKGKPIVYKTNRKSFDAITVDIMKNKIINLQRTKKKPKSTITNKELILICKKLFGAIDKSCQPELTNIGLFPIIKEHKKLIRKLNLLDLCQK